jgi:FkbM family methyltransferase
MIKYARPGGAPLMISYAQNFEDVLIDRVFRKQIGSYIDVGACHPVSESVTKYLSLCGWRGINIEPDRGMWEALVADRPNDINLHCAVGCARGQVTFHQLRNRAMSTINAEHLGNLESEALDGSIARQVPLRTLSDIMAEFVVGEIDLLKIDAEGSEADVIAGADWTRFRPRLLVIEATKPWTSDPNWDCWEPTLISHGYHFSFFDGINRYYLRSEDGDLLEQLSVPVNVLDMYRPYQEHWCRTRIAELENELASLRSARIA